MKAAFGLGLTTSAVLLMGACSNSQTGGMGAFAHDEDEVEVQLADCPEAVRATIEREAAAGTLREIERETEEGQTTYSAEVVIDGQEWEIEVGTDGAVLEREVEADDDDEND